MHISRPGKVTDRITLLGREESCVYLLDGGEEMAILGGGLVYIIPDLLAQLEKFKVDQEKIRRMFIHHAHFDHVGIAPYLKKRWPWLKITASKRAREQLARPKVIQAIVELSRVMLAKEGLEVPVEDLGWDINALEVEEAVSDGQEVTCGQVRLQCLETPGHSSCSMAVYIPEEKALSASDAGGIPYGQEVFASANSNFDLFEQSLAKMAQFDIQIHLAEHYGAFVGEDGRNFLKRTMDAAQKTRAAIEEILDRTGDEKAAMEEVTDLIMAGAPDYFLPREIMMTVTAQMTRFIAQKRSGGQG